MYGIDLDKELAAQRYGWLLDRILDLPDPRSRFRQAMSEDEEYAALLLDLEDRRQEEEGPAPSIQYSQLGLQESLLISIDTTLKASRAEAPFLQGAKGKPKYPEPWPLPVTAAERLRKVRDKEAADAVARRFGVREEDL